MDCRPPNPDCSPAIVIRRSTKGIWRLIPVFFLLPLAACDERTTNSPAHEPAGTPSLLIPISIGNSWTYIDSLIADSASTVDTFTVSIQSFRTDSLFTWWQFHDTRIASTYFAEFAVRNDSIFSLQHNEDRPVASLEYIPPAIADTLHYQSAFGGDVLLEKIVYLLSQSCVVPAGSFDSCAAYVWLNSPVAFVETIKPGVGIVATRFVTTSGEHRISLLDYSIRAENP